MKKIKSIKNIKNGFSLLEVMISLAITGGILVTLIYTLNYHLELAERQKTITDCTILAKQKLYEMERNPLNSKGQLEEPYSSFSYETAVLNSTFHRMQEIKVAVSRGKESVTLSKLISINK